MIRTAKTVTFPVTTITDAGNGTERSAEADGRDSGTVGTGNRGRRLETGLTFEPPPDEPGNGWRWQEDLVAGFVLSRPAATDDDPAGTTSEYRVAIWQDDAGSFSFDILSDDEPPEGELRTLLTEYIGYREIGGGTR
jgi:hypothetical protein